MSSITVGGLELAHPIMNAAGTCKSLPELRRFVRSGVAAGVVGSYTPEKRPEMFNAYYIDPAQRFSINSRKLNNGGRNYLRRYGTTMREVCCQQEKPLVLNIAADNPEGFGVMARLAVELGFSAIEVNLSCPTGAAPIFFQREPTALVVNAVNNAVRGRIPVWYKLGFIANPIELRSQVELITAKGADALVAINTIGGAQLFLRGMRTPIVQSAPIGLGGAALLPLGVGMVQQLSELVPNSVDIIGVGGIVTGADVQQYLTAGAKAVQVGTLCWAAHRDPDIYDELLAEYQSLP